MESHSCHAWTFPGPRLRTSFQDYRLDMQTEGGSVTRYGWEHQLRSSCLDLFREYKVISSSLLHVFRLWEENEEHMEVHALGEIMQPTYTLEFPLG